MIPLATLGFGCAAFMDLIIVFYSIKLVQRMGGLGFLSKTSKLMAFSAFSYGIHNIIKGFLGATQVFGTVADSFELLAGISFAIASYQIFKLTRG